MKLITGMLIMNILIYLKLDIGKETQGGIHQGVVLST